MHKFFLLKHKGHTIGGFTAQEETFLHLEATGQFLAGSEALRFVQHELGNQPMQLTLAYDDGVRVEASFSVHSKYIGKSYGIDQYKIGLSLCQQ